MAQKVNVKSKQTKSALKKKSNYIQARQNTPKVLFGEKFWNTVYAIMKLKQNFDISSKKPKIPVPGYNLPLPPLPSAQSKSFAELVPLQWN